MKKIFTLTALCGFVGLSVSAQEEAQVNKEVKKEQCTFFMKTAPLGELMKGLTPVDEETYYDNWEPKDRKLRSDWSQISDHGIPETNNIDPVRQTVYGTRSGEGMMKENWAGQAGAFPPDPTGAAGPNHYVQAVNSTYRVYDKDGTAITPAYALHTLWPGSTSDGDPIIMYDRYADRWFISQFQTGSNEILIAISETTDPLGSYYLYEFSFSSFPDYPKFAVWSNAYFMTANMGSNDCVGFEREKMIQGDASASMITMSFPNFYQFFNSVAPAYAEGMTAPEDDASGWAFAVQDDSWPGISDDHIKVLKIDLDWTTPSNSSVVVHQEITTANFNSVFTNSWDDITQQGTTQKLDAVTGIFMYRAQYRRWEGYNSMLLVTTVDANGANRAAVRWFELRENNDDNWYIYQEGTFDPDDGNSRWMGNAAMDLNGNIGLAYSFAGPSNYAGLRYTGRYTTDPLGDMTIEEQIAVEGTGAQTGGNRYGDYSQMTVDPSDDATLWFTGEYLGASGSRRTRIFSFAMWELLGEEERPVGNPFFNAFQPNTEQLTILWKDLKDQQFDINVLDMNGKLIAQELNVDASQNQMVFNIPSTATGIYLVQLNGENTQLSEKIYLGK
ncbi:MAG: T9SS type A sorting domain-containing protein [Crocinitomicaceae bacterium]